MKSLLVFLAVVAYASGATYDILPGKPLDKPSAFYAPIVKSTYDISPEGSYQYNYETGNGIYGQAEAVLKKVNSEYPTLEVTGANKYTSPEGQVVELTYVANENGYQPQGSHLPVAPPVPEAIARALAYIAAHPPSPTKEEYKYVGVGSVAKIPILATLTG